MYQRSGVGHPFTLPGELSFAPWTDLEVAYLNEYQRSGAAHPFTAGARDMVDHDIVPREVVLVATREGWVRPGGRLVVQSWAWRWMTDGSWRMERGSTL